jgi:hypothetical protein
VAVEDEDASNWWPRATERAATTTTPTTRILRIRSRRVVRAGSRSVTLLSKAPWCCQHVSGFRYADDMRQL